MATRFLQAMMVAWMLAACAGRPVTSDGSGLGEPVRGPCNALILDDTFVSCGAPDDACRAWLVEHRVDTLICVDGSEPDIEAANRAGLKVLHLPFSYDGVPEAVTLAISRAALESRARNRSLAIHCHHGAHRSPAAAATAMRALGTSVAEAEAALILAGTSPGYPGLWRDALEQEALQVETEDALAAVPLAWNTTVPPAEFVRLMGEMESRINAMHASITRGEPPAAADAGAFADALRLCAAQGRGHAEGVELALLELAGEAQALEAFLTSASMADDVEHGGAGIDVAGIHDAEVRAAAAALGVIQESCRTCHQVHRDR
ncbi:MAG: hypothetical protein O2819_05920 [Planctomycetota bacterium]|nr:hypothetical protein [Planctomycetota bacterium]MDA1106386.1 hypothetical protein [Planctomycetota bacterium]